MDRLELGREVPIGLYAAGSLINARHERLVRFSGNRLLDHPPRQDQALLRVGESQWRADPDMPGSRHWI